MAEYLQISRSDGTTIEIAWTGPSDGDFHIDDPDGRLAERRHGVMDGEWAAVRQIHGSEIVDAAAALDPTNLPEADGLTTADAGQPISVQGADCAPIAFVTEAGPIGVAHAGWRGLAAGIIAAMVEVLDDYGTRTTSAIVGPVICTECYEFGADDLDTVASHLGDAVRSTTPNGTPALDMRAAINAGFAACGVDDVTFVGGCPSCDGTGFSHRARKDPQRHSLAARIHASGDTVE